MTQEELKAVLSYDPETGIFTWKARAKVRGGRRAGGMGPFGYVKIGLGGRPSKVHQAHRLAWLYMTGESPTGDIDHINGDRADNRWANLRHVSRGVNLQNMRKAHADSDTGYLGVFRNRGRYGARIQVDRKQIYLGTFDTPQLAHDAYLQAKRRLHPGCTI